MTLDGGWGYILSTVIGVVLAEMLGFARRFSDHRKEVNDDATTRAQLAAENAGNHAKRIENEFLRYQAHVAETYSRASDTKEFERAVFEKLDDIVKLINTKADK